ncbi:hypothetical protein [Salinarimonas chemoclinalis]|uniref:hypothetical protein n=1 Tax=Salinarimonas chemoclinalis TaxID=3241599 RepID=UPI0035579BAD
MIMTIVDSGGKLPKGAAAAVFAMLAYVAAASIVAGLGDLGAGLLVLVMGAVAVGVVDYVMWRDLSLDGENLSRDGRSAGEGARLGSYVLAGPEGPGSPEMPAAILPFHPVRTETAPAEAAPAPVPSSPPAEPSREAAATESVDVVPIAASIAHAAPAAPPAETPAETPAAAPVPAAGAAEVQADTVGTRPPTLDAPRGTADDLKRINGIGPANEKKLNALGIHHFDQIAAWDEAQVRWVGTYLAFPGRIERERWVAQARTLAGISADRPAEQNAPA